MTLFDPEESNLFFHHSFDLLAVVGTDGYFKRVNPAFHRTMGYSEEELCAIPLVEFLHPDDVSKTKTKMQTLASGTPTIESVNRYRCKDGGYRWFSWNTIPTGELLYTIGRDITEQVATEERIRQLNAELKRKNEDLELEIQRRLSELKKSEARVQQLQKLDAVGRLAGGIAHDFNNILGAITLYCDVLAEHSGERELFEKTLRDLQQVTARGSALTRQLLLFSRKQIVALQSIDLNPLIQQLQTMLVRLIGKNVKIVTNLSSDLKFVSADPNQMEQVILNLVVNARDAMPSGGTITIETSNVFLDDAFISTQLQVDRGHYVLLSVTDDGCGMDSDTMAKMFEPFFTTKTIGKGTGLGLTTVYGITKQCNGTIGVYSEPGKGTVFKVYLPATEETKLLEAPTAEISEWSGNETILLVENDEELRSGFSMMLSGQGYELLVAANGKEALELCERHSGPIHLLLTDMIMPEIGGVDLARKARAIRSGLKILYMSGYISDAMEDQERDDLARLDFIQKPFTTSTLVAKLREVLSRPLRH